MFYLSKGILIIFCIRLYCNFASDVIPKSGFIQGFTGEEIISFKVLSEHYGTHACTSLRFENSIFKGKDSVFNLVLKDEVYINDRNVWFNGADYLSFLLPSPENGSPYGTWIVGPKPGEDSGIAYAKPAFETLVPESILHDFEIEWFFLENQKWTAIKGSRLQCFKDQYLSRFYSATYIKSSTREEINTFLIIPGNEYIASTQILHIGTADYISSVKASYFDSLKAQWVSLEEIPLVISFGVPIWLTTYNITKGSHSISQDELSSKSQPYSCIAILVNSEFLDDCWRLMFRCLETDEEYFPKLGNEGIYSSEFSLEIKPLTSAEIEIDYMKTMETISQVNQGDYLWLWYVKDDFSNNVRLSNENLLIKCVGQSNSAKVFQYYFNDRKNQMERSILSQESDLLILKSSSLNTTLVWKGLLSGIDIHVLSLVTMGSDLTRWISNYIYKHEGTFGGISSCFLYHAALALPAPLVYTTEVVCVLLGAKPVAMVQFTSKTDQQLKFPLVQELTTSIMIRKETDPDFPIDYRIHKYFSDETVIIFRKSRNYLANSLRPLHQAQALHIVPYPGSDALLNVQEWKEQIYNSWWNGFVLGYPEHFIDTYCISFHNDLTNDEKLEQMQMANRDVKAYFAANKFERVTIKLGLDQALNF